MDDIVLTMRKPPCPCNGCVPPERYVGCHGSCEKYEDWTHACTDARNELIKERDAELAERLIRMKRRGWSKGAKYR